ncbi:non-ribosomal peptide synthetase [[Flexibacter] sp. ATCC 35208]|uniref:non-ribosomal peptide synthetase n=1 Tax=[Flexibacter] sp. ATCC 35208 TaxID=1936242 RepID=UPI0009CF1A03|nr:non-ribosomal peptide synthetase [[Flexibacter] sp. ATCC 35208]OMP79332.1 hypothetical protein BW716_09525 [[Flexibacter] sp. ATCC 35208]
MQERIENQLLREYWLKKIHGKDISAIGAIVPDFSRTIILPEEETGYFQHLTGRQPMAVYTVYLAVYMLLLKRYFPAFGGSVLSYDIIRAQQFADTPLLFYNLPNIRLTLRQLLHEMKKEVQEVYSHAIYDPAEWQNTPGTVSFRQLTDFTFSCHSQAPRPLQAMPFNFCIDGNTFSIHTSSDFTDSFVAAHFLNQYVNWIRQLEAYIDIPIGEVSLLLADEKDLLLHTFNSRKEYPHDATMVSLFEARVQSDPHAIALVHRGREMTYGELNCAVNKMAHYLLQNYLLSRDSVVGILLPKSDDFVVAMLAILKTGAAYLPVDRNYPAERIAHIIDDSRIQLLITAAPAFESISAVVYDESLWQQEPVVNPDCEILHGDTAYVIYTSGSTGKPKGAMVTHGGNINMSLDMISRLELSAADRVTWVASLAFDASVAEVMTALYSGATILIPEEMLVKDPVQFGAFLRETTTSVISVTPGYLDLLTDGDLAGIRCLITAGEAAHVPKVTGLAKNILCFNAYGPTECAVCVSMYRVMPEDSTRKTLPIGRPIANLSVLILDDLLQLVPVGIEGTIFVAGVGVGKGYLNNERLTCERFIEHPVHGTRMYNTGDVGRWLPDGNIEFKGRNDEQLKLRGYRIEAGEVEAAIVRFSPDIQQVVVTVKETAQNKVLVAYFVANSLIEQDVLRKFLTGTLPEYMVPGFFMQLNILPLTPNGKIDKKQLPDFHLQKENYVPPANALQQQLVVIWETLLGIPGIGVHDDFLALGGNSLMLASAGAAIRNALGADVQVKELFANPTILLQEALIHERLGTSVVPLMTVQQRPPKIPLSFAQERIWLLDRLEGSIHYHIPIVLKLNGNLDKGALHAAFIAMLDRHEVLRTVIREEDGMGYQYIQPIPLFELDSVTVGNAMVEQYITEWVNQPFRLAEDLLLRACLLSQSEGDTYLIIVMHHLIADGWSMPLFVNELTSFYKAKGNTIDAGLPVLPVQYADYALWQRAYLKGELLVHKLAYWENKLDGIQRLALPFDKTRPATRTFKGGACHFYIDPALTAQLKALSAREGVTLFMTLLAAFKVLLYRYTGQDDISVGSPLANRGQFEIAPLIGFFVNMVVLRDDLSGNPTFCSLLAKVKETSLDAFTHGDVPFEKVVDVVETTRDPAHTALFQVLFVLQNNIPVTIPELDDVSFSVLPFEQEVAKFDLTFTFTENENDIQYAIQYNSDLFFAATIERMAGNFDVLLRAIMENPEQRIGNYSILTAADQQLQPLIASVDFPEQKTITDLFEDHARRTPDAPALIFGSQVRTYREVDEQANRLAHYIRTLGVTEDSKVVICIGQAYEQVLTAILAVLKAGAVYVPIDTDAPQERLQYIIQQTDAALVITDRTGVALFEDTDLIVIQVDEMLLPMISDRPDKPVVNRHSARLIYVIYTSGSTGEPKGVMVSHRNVMDYVFGLFSATDIQINRSFALMSTIATDLGNTVLFGALAAGGTLHTFTKNTLSTPALLHEYFAVNRIDCMKIVPSYWHTLERGGKLLLPEQMIIFGGEELTEEYRESIYAARPGISVINHYGPTETTVGKLLHKVAATHSYNAIPIGKPFSNTRIYIVNRDFALCPVGVPGELWIGGEGVAPGYLHNPDLTNARFIDDPFDASNKYKLYRTGDLVCQLPDGDILFKGRIDKQVKIRGYRVEPGEIEAILQQSPSVKQSVVTVFKDHNGYNQLAAYIVSAGDFDPGDLTKKLPAYMIPTVIMKLEKLPFTSNGKINRHALPSPMTAESGAAHIAPGNEMEQRLAAIWQSLLGKSQIGVTDNFFEMGGNSLTAIRLINQVEQQFGRTITLREVFGNFDIRHMAVLLASRGERAGIKISRIAPQPDYALSANQQRLWVASQDADGLTAYNISGGAVLNGPLDLVLLEQAYWHMIERHESLRTVFVNGEDGLPRQQILPALSREDWAMQTLDWLLTDEEMLINIERENAIPFDLLHDQLIRIKILSDVAQQHLLVVVMHHIISDGWSMDIFIKEWMALYAGLKTGHMPSLPVLPVRYRDFAAWQQAWLRSDEFVLTAAYWKERLAGELPVLQLPFSSARTANNDGRGEGYDFPVPDELYGRLKQLAVSDQTSLFPVLFTAFNILLYHISKQQEIILGTSVAGRGHESLEPLIGFFVNTVAIRTTIDPSASFSVLLKLVNAQLQNDFAHQEMPFDQLLSLLSYKRIPGVHPIFQARFVLNNADDDFGARLKALQLSARKMMPREIQSKFDLSLVMRPGTRHLSGIVEYKSSLFKRELITLIISAYLQLLEIIVVHPGKPIHELNTFSDRFRQQVDSDRKVQQAQLLDKFKQFRKK